LAAKSADLASLLAGMLDHQRIAVRDSVGEGFLIGKLPPYIIPRPASWRAAGGAVLPSSA
jgi:hypothetical protein